MDQYRPFGACSGNISQTDSKTVPAELYMKVGTRIGVITAYYTHINPVAALPSKDTSNVYDVPKPKSVKFHESTSASNVLPPNPRS